MSRLDVGPAQRLPDPGGRRLLPAVLAAGVVAVLALGAWSLSWALSSDLDLEPGEAAIDNGVVQVDGVASAARPSMAMPGMGTDEDPVPDGMRRVSVDVTLKATEDEPVEFEVDRFALEVDGEDAVPPHRSVLPESTLPPGTQLSGTLVFQVPNDATGGVLSYDGGTGTEVALPPEVSDGGGGHSGSPGPSAPHPSSAPSH